MLVVLQALPYSPQGHQVASINEDNTIRLWDRSRGGCLHTLTSHSDIISFAVYSPQESKLHPTNKDGTVISWVVQTGECRPIRTDHIDDDIARSPRG